MGSSFKPVEGSTVPFARFQETRKYEGIDSDFLDFDGEGDEIAVEEITINTPLAATNVGFKLALKMGWVQGKGLGKHGSGRVDPIPFDPKQDFLGIGKGEQEDAQHKETTAKRRTMDSEMEETEELKRRREEETLKDERIKKELEETNRVFLCELCNKQYTKPLEFQNHLSSYDHHHKQRMKEMQESANSKDISRNKKLEQKREERELKRIHEQALAMTQAASQKSQEQPKAAPAAVPPPPLPPTPQQPPLPPMPSLPRGPPLPPGPAPPGSSAPPGPPKPAFSFSMNKQQGPGLKKPAFSLDDDD